MVLTDISSYSEDKNTPLYIDHISTSISPPTAKKKSEALQCRTVYIGTRRTSVRIEPEMWDALNFIIHNENTTQGELLHLVFQSKKKSSSFSSAIRVFVMMYFRSASTKEGHIRAGHGDIALMRSRCSVLSRKKHKAHDEI